MRNYENRRGEGSTTKDETRRACVRKHLSEWPKEEKIFPYGKGHCPEDVLRLHDVRGGDCRRQMECETAGPCVPDTNCRRGIFKMRRADGDGDPLPASKKSFMGSSHGRFTNPNLCSCPLLDSERLLVSGASLYLYVAPSHTRLTLPSPLIPSPSLLAPPRPAPDPHPTLLFHFSLFPSQLLQLSPFNCLSSSVSSRRPRHPLNSLRRLIPERCYIASSLPHIST